MPERKARKRALETIENEFGKEDYAGRRLAAGVRRSFAPGTVNRYLRSGERELRGGEMRLAVEIDRKAEEIGLEAALECGDYGCGSYGGALRRRYERGRRALKKAKSKSR